jgi:hypothetical protein
MAPGYGIRRGGAAARRWELNSPCSGAGLVLGGGHWVVGNHIDRRVSSGWTYCWEKIHDSLRAALPPTLGRSMASRTANGPSVIRGTDDPSGLAVWCVRHVAPECKCSRGRWSVRLRKPFPARLTLRHPDAVCLSAMVMWPVPMSRSHRDCKRMGRDLRDRGPSRSPVCLADRVLWIIEQVVVPAVSGVVFSPRRANPIVRPAVPPEGIALLAEPPVVLKDVSRHQHNLLEEGIGLANIHHFGRANELRISGGSTKSATCSMGPMSCQVSVSAARQGGRARHPHSGFLAKHRRHQDLFAVGGDVLHAQAQRS